MRGTIEGEALRVGLETAGLHKAVHRIVAGEGCTGKGEFGLHRPAHRWRVRANGGGAYSATSVLLCGAPSFPLPPELEACSLSPFPSGAPPLASACTGAAPI